MSQSRKRSRAEASLFGAHNDRRTSSNNNSMNAMLPPENPRGANSRNSTSASLPGEDDFVLGSKITTPSRLFDHATTSTATAAAPSTGALSLSVESDTPRLSAHSSSRSSMPTSSSSTLFGRVMQQSAQKPRSSLTEQTSQQPPQPNENNVDNIINDNNSTFQTPTKVKRQSSASKLLTPGGFNLQNAVQAAVASSPFAFAAFGDHSNSGASNLSCATPVRKPAWRLASSSLDDLPRDWSLKEKVILQSSAFEEPSAWRCLQRTVVLEDDACRTGHLQSTFVRKWHAARTHWQYPIAPIEKSREKSYMEQSESSTFTTMEASKFVYSKMESRAERTVSESDTAWQKLQYPPGTKASQNEMEWETSIASLYQGWRLGKDDSTSYFYCFGQDHTILFFYHGREPHAMISSCNKEFRSWFHSQGLYVKVGFGALAEDWCEETSAKRWKDPGKSADISPPSPALAAELAALRRAHVYGNTVGADVSVSVRGKGAGANQIASQRRALQQVPPLLATGADACDALVEYYRNKRGQMVGPLSHLPYLLAPYSMGPFCHASLQSAAVRLLPGRIEVHGTLLPGSTNALVSSIVDTLGELSSKKDDDDDGDNNVRLDVKTTACRSAAPTIRPLDDVVVGQANLFSLDDDTGEIMSQLVWDSDQPDSISYKVDTASLSFGK